MRRFGIRKTAELKEDAKLESDEQMKELQKKQEATNKKLKELKSAGRGFCLMISSIIAANAMMNSVD